MIEFLQVLGLMLLVVSLAAGIVLVTRYSRRHGGFGFGSGLSKGRGTLNAPASSAPPVDSEQANPSGPYWWNKRDEQPLIEVNGEKCFVEARCVLHEMTQLSSDEPWTRTEVQLLALLLEAGRWILKIRRREGDQPIWLVGERLSAYDLTSFYIGTEGEPGPARLFRMNNQTLPIPYELPVSPYGWWEVWDIGTVDAEVPEAENDVWAFQNGDRQYFVTSRNREGEYLVFFDAREEARGVGGVFLFQEFTPSLDVLDLMRSQHD